MKLVCANKMADEKCQKSLNLKEVFHDDNDNLERLGPIGYDEFFKDYLLQNRLCIFSSELTKDWRSRQEWVKDGRPDYDFMVKSFGEAKVPVANCDERYFSSQCKEDMKLVDFIKYLKTRENNEPGDQACLYLKDWHFCKAFPDYNAYETPVYFKSDWLNEYWDQCNDVSDDYRFVYFGPKGSWTPFHADVFRSYSWSANICGCKKWIIFPPGQEDYLQDSLGNLTYDVTSSEITDDKKFPQGKQIQKPIIVVQKEGEVIFVPSGWYHQVHNLEDTVSINHNWTNACGLMKMWNHLQSELNKVQQSIQDCRDMDNWHDHCQLMLKAMSGMDYKDFVHFLLAIAKPRLDFIQSSKKPSHGLSASQAVVFLDWINAIMMIEDGEEFDVYDLCKYDVLVLQRCTVHVKHDKSFQELDDQDAKLKVVELLEQITNVLGNDQEKWGKIAMTCVDL